MVYAFGSDSIPSIKNACMIACKHSLSIISAYCIKYLTWFLTSKMSFTEVYRYCLATLWDGFVFGLIVCWGFFFFYKDLLSKLTDDTMYSEASNAMSI